MSSLRVGIVDIVWGSGLVVDFIVEFVDWMVPPSFYEIDHVDVERYDFVLYEWARKAPAVAVEEHDIDVGVVVVVSGVGT